MKDFLNYLLTNIVSNTDEIAIEEQADDHQLILKLKVADDDMGKVIGKGGKVIAALRTLVRLRNQLTKEHPMVLLQLIDTKTS